MLRVLWRSPLKTVYQGRTYIDLDQGKLQGINLELRPARGSCRLFRISTCICRAGKTHCCPDGKAGTWSCV